MAPPVATIASTEYILVVHPSLPVASLRELIAFEDVAATVNYQSFANVESIGQQVVIESIRFTQTSPSNPNRHEGAGGILLLQLRTVNP